jgi:hypothetical protein
LVLGVLPVPEQLNGLHLADDAAVSVAGATLFLALFTAASVSEGRRERLVSERALEASWRPILVDVPIGELEERGSIWSFDRGRPSLQRMSAPTKYLRPTVPLLNAGLGPAVITSASLDVRDKASVGVPQISSSIVPAGHLTTIFFEVPLDREDLAPLVEELIKEGDSRPPLLVRVHYGDQAGRGQWLSEIHIHPASAARWYVRQVRVVDAKTHRTVFMSGPKVGDTKS